MSIHPSAIIEDVPRLAHVIGPFCTSGPVVLRQGSPLKSHVVVTGDTQIGADTTIFPFCCIGEIPQDVKFKGEAAKLVIGERNRIREHVTMNPGTEGGGGITSIGDDGFFLAGVTWRMMRVGDQVIIVNQSAVAGHCVIEDDVIIGGRAASTSLFGAARLLARPWSTTSFRTDRTRGELTG
jgi:UDP-N-acetylglucosamine acyltransferase